MRQTIGLVYDLRTDYLREGYSEEAVVEFDMEATIDEIEQAIRANGFATDRIGHGRALCRRLAAGDRWDLVFNIAEGLTGRSREAQVPAVLELFGVPYTFSDPLVSALTLDKALTKIVVRAAGIRTPDFAVIQAPGDLDGVRLAYPLFAKPIAEGTGKGIDHRSRIVSPDQLKTIVVELLDRFGQPVLVEEYLPGREFTVGVLGAGPRARALGTMEVEILDKQCEGIYSMAMKERCEELVRYSAFVDDQKLRAEIEAMAVRAYAALDLRDAGRVDIRVDARGRPGFMEVNPLPGLHPRHSDLPMIATQEGMPYETLIGQILSSAFDRHTMRASI